MGSPILRFGRSLAGALLASCVGVAGSDALRAQLILAGSPDGTVGIVVDDDLDVYVNDVLVYSDADALSGTRPPFPLPGAVGDTVRVVVRDTYGVCSQLGPIFVVAPSGRGTCLVDGFDIGCGRPNENLGVVYDVSKPIPDPNASLELYQDVQLPASAWAGVVPGPGGFLYGTTYEGGGANQGTLYVVPPDLCRVDTLHEFSGPDGSIPYSEVTVGTGAATGKLFGTTCYGGASDGGTLFAFDLETRQLTTLRSFDLYSCPLTAPLQIGDVLYGSIRGVGGGTVYRIDTDGTDYAPLHSFSLAEGYDPGALVDGGDGFLYGVATFGGEPTCGTGSPVAGCGTAFRVAINGSQFQLVHTFVGPEFGAKFPQRRVSFGPGGRLYGTTYTGVFSLAPVPGAPDFKLLESLTNQDGGQIFAPPTLGSDDRIYVVQYDGGSAGLGRVFSLGADGMGFLLHHEFTLAAGYAPYGILRFDAGGALYGTTEYGYGSDPPYKGTVFRLDRRSLQGLFADDFESGLAPWALVRP